jgi:6-phosphogluconolactonase (cycloisomerase 2 family)
MRNHGIRLAAALLMLAGSGGLASAGVSAIGDYDFAQVLAHPGGRFLYLGDASFPGLAVDVVDPTTGAIGGRRFADGTATTNAVFDPMGCHLYAIAGTSAADPAVLAYTVDEATGQLAPIGTQAEGTLVAMHPTGRAVYVARSGGDVLAYARDEASGALRLLGRVAGETSPTQLAVDTRGRWLYVATSRVTAYALDPAGAFAGGSTSAAARGRLAVDPDGRFLYVARQEAPEIVAIPTDGAALGPPRTVAALHAAWIAIAP